MRSAAVDVDPDLLAAGAVRVERGGCVLTVSLDRPEARNAQTPATWRALAAVGERLPEDVRVVIVRGEGTSFSAGLDRRLLTPEGVPGERSLFELAALPGDELDAVLRSFQAGFTWLRDQRVISVAAVQGHAVGAGFQLALACDLRIVADDVRLAMRETSLGLVPDLTGTSPLVQAMGYSRALEVCVTGRWIGAEEAVRTGLASLQVRREDLDDAVADVVAALLEPDVDATRATKALLQAAVGGLPAEQDAVERRAQALRLAALARARGG